MWKCQNISFKEHLLFAFVIRVVLMVYSEYHDQVAEVPYTDVDYRVFTDASRHVWNFRSPYDRHTYRYTPLIAFILLPNIFLHSCFGKVLFSLADLVVGLLIRTIVLHNRKQYSLFKDKLSKKYDLQIENQDDNKAIEDTTNNDNAKQSCDSEKNTSVKKKNSEDNSIADYSMLFWIYNPLTIACSTRGSCDSVAVLFVLLTIYFLQCKRKCFIAGLIHGLAIHIRLYPIMYSLPLFLHLSSFSEYSINKRITNNVARVISDKKKNAKQNEVEKRFDETSRHQKTIFKMDYLYYLIPNRDQWSLISGCLLSLVTSIAFFYYLYGYNFLYETYLFHIIRKDTRHNFSVFFYMQYLTAGVKNIGVWQKLLSVLPQIVLLLVLSVRYGLNKFTLNFSILTQTIVMVAYNSVLTSQYFIWILAVLPLTLWQLHMSLRSSLIWAAIWFSAQGAWLLPAYLLEFHGQNTFLYVWLQSVSFFCANMAILGRLIKCFMYKMDK